MNRARSRTGVAVAVTLALLSVLGVGLLIARRPPPAPPSAVAAKPSKPIAIEWPGGREQLFDVSWTTRTEVPLGAAQGASALSSNVDLAAELAIGSYGPRGDGFLLAARIEDIRRHGLEVLGQETLPDLETAKRELEGPTMVFEVDRFGTLRRLYAKTGGDGAFASVMRGVLLELSFTLSAGAVTEWTASEQGGLGLAKVRYRAETEPRGFARTRTHYDHLLAIPNDSLEDRTEDLRSTTRGAVDDDGHLASVKTDERLVVPGPQRGVTLRSTTAFELRRSGERPFDASVPPDVNVAADWAPQSVDSPPVPADATAQTLEKRAAGMTYDAVIAGVVQYSATGSIPAQAKFLYAATGLLMLHPELCARMAAEFQKSEATVRGQALVLDLLASTGSPEAQDAMRVAIASPAARLDPKSYPLLIQRFVFIPSPTPATASFLLARYNAARSIDERNALANSLGAASAKMARDPALKAQADSIHARIASDLRTTTEPKERRGLITALSQAKDPSDAKAIAHFASDTDPFVRVDTAFALGRIDSSDAADALVPMTSDASGDVAHAAMRALETESLSPDQLGALAALVLAGKTPQSQDRSLVGAMARQQGDSVATILNYIATRDASDGALVARIQGMLAQQQSSQ